MSHTLAINFSFLVDANNRIWHIAFFVEIIFNITKLKVNEKEWRIGSSEIVFVAVWRFSELQRVKKVRN